MSDEERRARNARELSMLTTAEFAHGVTIGYALAHAPEASGELDWQAMLSACDVMIARAKTANLPDDVEDWTAIAAKVRVLAGADGTLN